MDEWKNGGVAKRGSWEGREMQSAWDVLCEGWDRLSATHGQWAMDGACTIRMCSPPSETLPILIHVQAIRTDSIRIRAVDNEEPYSQEQRSTLNTQHWTAASFARCGYVSQGVSKQSVGIWK